MARFLAKCGAWRPPGPDVNDGTALEHQLRTTLLEKLLAHFGTPPSGLASVPPFPYQIDVQGLTELVEHTLVQLGYKPRQHWLCSDYRLGLLWITFAKAYPAATWVLVRQPLEGFLKDSQESLSGLQADARLELASEYLKRLDAMKGALPQVHEVWLDSEGGLPPESGYALARELELPELPVETANPDVSTTPRGTEARAAVSHIRHYATNEPLFISRDVAIVGGSDALLGTGLGPSIDRHETIVRFNLASTGDNYAADVGTRSTHYFMRKDIDKVLADGGEVARTHFRQICRANQVICYPGHFDVVMPYNDTPLHYEMSPQKLNSLFSDLLGADYQAFPPINHPRNGIKLLACVLAAGLTPTLYGFDLDERAGARNYFDDVLVEEAPGPGHKPSLEFRLLSQLAAAGHVRLGR